MMNKIMYKKMEQKSSNNYNKNKMIQMMMKIKKLKNKKV